MKRKSWLQATVRDEELHKDCTRRTATRDRRMAKRKAPYKLTNDEGKEFRNEVNSILHAKLYQHGPFDEPKELTKKELREQQHELDLVMEEPAELLRDMALEIDLAYPWVQEFEKAVKAKDNAEIGRTLMKGMYHYAVLINNN